MRPHDTRDIARLSALSLPARDRAASPSQLRAEAGPALQQHRGAWPPILLPNFTASERVCASRRCNQPDAPPVGMAQLLPLAAWPAARKGADRSERLAEP